MRPEGGHEDDWHVRDTRGVSRALRGDVPRAIEDLQFVVEQAKDNEPIRTQREGWLKQLRAGKSPFTPEELKTLEDQ